MRPFKLADPRNRFLRESILLSAAAVVFILFSQIWGWFTPLDRLLYDTVIARTAAPMSERIVLVTIDEQSLHAHGPWPWPRARQAALIREINAQRPALIAMDIIYSGFAPQTEILVDAIEEASPVALPLMIDTLGQDGQHIEVLPVPELLTRNPLLGHVQIERDDDAIVRGTYLYQGVGQPHWPHLMLTVAEQQGYEFNLDRCNVDETPLYISKCNYVRLPFAGPPGTFPQVSANFLLQPGTVEPGLLDSALRDKIVLVGITAIGGGDVITSPLGNETTPLSGVEFNANLLSALMSNSLIKTTPPGVLFLLSSLIAVFACFALPRLSPKTALLASLALAVAPIFFTSSLLAGVWLHAPLANATFATLLIYPLWSWRRHEIAWSYIQAELDRIDSEERRLSIQGEGLPRAASGANLNGLKTLLQADLTQPIADLEEQAETLTMPERAVLRDHLFRPVDLKRPRPPAERLAAQIGRLEQRAKHLREGREIGLAGLERMQNGALILSALGEVRFINSTARNLLNWQQGSAAIKQLEELPPPLGQNWLDIWRACVLKKTSINFESTAQSSAKPVFVTVAPLEHTEPLAYAPSWVVTLSDLSDIRAAEAQREEALAFLSHDLRSPLTSILALLQSTGTTADANVLKDIERYTRKGLSTSDQFLQLSRLQLQSHFETYPLDLEQVLHNSVEQVYFLARDKDISIDIDAPGDAQAWVVGNGELLERAFVNLLGNAIKYSDRSTRIVAALRTLGSQIETRITDQGPGIPEDELDMIFEPFFRSAEPRLAQQRGAGLGLRFVKTVADRHHGNIRVESTWGSGSSFVVTLPAEAST